MKRMPHKIVISGPESTGKTELAAYLAETFKGLILPEYARSYVENLDRRYTYADVEHIAGVQEQEFTQAMQKGYGYVFLDTYLVITKVWFQEAFGRMPEWIDGRLRLAGIDLFLLCYPDLEWVEDGVRENPGERRTYLFERYRAEIAGLHRPFEVIRGCGEERFRNALAAMHRHFPDSLNTIS